MEEQQTQLQRKTYALYYQLVKNVSEGTPSFLSRSKHRTAPRQQYAAPGQHHTVPGQHYAAPGQHHTASPHTGTLAANVVFDLGIPKLPATVMDLTNAYVPLAALHSTWPARTADPFSVGSWPPMKFSSSCSLRSPPSPSQITKPT